MINQMVRDQVRDGSGLVLISEPEILETDSNRVRVRLCRCLTLASDTTNSSSCADPRCLLQTEKNNLKRCEVSVPGYRC